MFSSVKESTAPSIKACPSFPDSQSFQKLMLKRLDGKVRKTVAFIFDHHHSGLAYNDPSTFKVATDTLHEAIKTSGRHYHPMVEFICGRYLLHELDSFFQAKEPTDHASRAELTVDQISNSNTASQSELRIVMNRFEDNDAIDAAGDDDAMIEEEEHGSDLEGEAAIEDSDDMKRVRQGSDLYNKFSLILRVCKNAAGFVDGNGVTLLHHLLLYCGDWMSERSTFSTGASHCSHDLHRILFMLCRIVYVSFPSNATLLAQTSHGFVTPFQLLLMDHSHHPIDFELASMMLATAPSLARMVDHTKRLPIHNLVSKLHYMSPIPHSLIVLLKQLLACFPQGAFCEVSEEIRSIRIQPIVTPTSDERVERTTTNGERHYNFVAEKITWSPIEKVRESNHAQVVKVFDAFLDKMFWKQRHSQIRMR